MLPRWVVRLDKYSSCSLLLHGLMLAVLSVMTPRPVLLPAVPAVHISLQHVVMPQPEAKPVEKKPQVAKKPVVKKAEVVKKPAEVKKPVEKKVDKPIEDKKQVEQQAAKQAQLGVISQHVGQNWYMPIAVNYHQRPVTLSIECDDKGRVLHVTVKESSGSQAMDRSAVNAVYKSSPLPLPTQSELRKQFRHFEMVVG